MIQPRLFQDDADNDRWAPVMPPYRVPPAEILNSEMR
jgi:hypothetical protein